MFKIRQLCDCLIFDMGIPIPWKDCLYIETRPRYFSSAKTPTDLPGVATSSAFSSKSLLEFTATLLLSSRSLVVSGHKGIRYFNQYKKKKKITVSLKHIRPCTGDMMLIRLSYLPNTIFYTGKRASLYWNNPRGLSQHKDAILPALRFSS